MRSGGEVKDNATKVHKKERFVDINLSNFMKCLYWQKPPFLAAGGIERKHHAEA